MTSAPPPDAVKKLAKGILEIGWDDLPARERHVIEHVARRVAVSRNVSEAYEESRRFGERLSDRINFDLDDARDCCGLQWRRQDFFRIVIKPFMDAWTYDQSRVDECCIHVIRPGGEAVSFCQFNTIERGRDGRVSPGSPEVSHVVGAR